ncbi:MAG: hypothetical protein QNJ47_23015 [Nostocaceae cyanobacterium]|nr:hypothetical protein [Nostocaceae cyanobacterium]
MNPQSEEDLQYRLQKLEAEINSSQSPEMTETNQGGFPNLNLHLTRFLNWFRSLSGIGKLIVGGVGFVFTLAILQAVFKLVTAVISLTVLAVLVYLGYKFVVSSNLKDNQ